MKKVILISGGSEGLGFETAKLLSPQYTVIILAHHKEKLEAAAKTIGCDFELCDLTKTGDIATAIKNVIRKHGRIDCLINNAGIFAEGKLEDHSEKTIFEVFGVNVLGLIMLSREVIPFMKKQKGGLVINISSQAGLFGKAERSIYNASKFAVTGFTKSLQMEVSKDNIAVTGIYPGKMKTKIFETAGLTKDLSNAIEPREVAKTIEFIISLDPSTVATEIGIKRIND